MILINKKKVITINKYNINLPNNEIIEVYFNTIEEALEYINKFIPEITKDNITIDTELIYMKYVNDIIDNSDSVVCLKNKKHYLYKSNRGLIPVNLWEQDDFYFDGLQYIEGRFDKENNTIKPFEGSFSNPIGWVWGNPKEFLDMFSDKNKLEFTLHSFRKYGQPKLSKPKELKGIKQVFSIDYIMKKCKCPIFILGNDVYIQHKDYFSPSMEVEPEDIGLPLGVLTEKYLGHQKGKNKSFIYPDTWGDIVLRQEAWICIKNLMYRIKNNDFELNILTEILRQQEKYHYWKENELCNTNMERFWEHVIKECKKYVNQNKEGE